LAEYWQKQIEKFINKTWW